MLHNEARRLLVQAYEQTHDAQTAAKCFQVSTSTVYRLSGQKKKTGSVELQTSQRGRKPALTEEDLLGIDQLIIGQPDITIDEIIEKQGLSVSNVIKLAAKKETAEGNGIPKEIQKELIRKKRQQKQTEAAPSEKGYSKGQRAEA